VSTEPELSQLHESNIRPAAKRTFQQGAAICCRVNQGAIEVLLITNRDTGRWIIPKGNIERGEKPYQCALREALEEAGVWGKVRKKAIGSYSYSKTLDRHLNVSVHVVKVEAERASFPERRSRSKLWVIPRDAAALVGEPALKEIFKLVDLRTPLHSQDKPKRRRYRRRLNFEIAASITNVFGHTCEIGGHQ
jgi:8-oxo-dGTP pyrophosphatase MutT (NUDIX family)